MGINRSSSFPLIVITLKTTCLKRNFMKLTLHRPTVEYFILDLIKFVCKGKDQDFRVKNSEEKFKLTVFLKEKIMLEFLPDQFKNYKNTHDYSKRCSLLNRAICIKEEEIIKILNDKFCAQRPEYRNVFVISDELFGELVSTFNSETMFNWNFISEQQSLPWTEDIINDGRYLWDWSKLQINPTASKLLCDFNIVDQYSELLDWDILSREPRLKWTSKELTKHKNKIFFKNDALPFYKDFPNQSEFYIKNHNHFLAEGFSSRQDLSDDIIYEFQNYFNWGTLSLNHNIGQNPEFIVKYFSRIDFYQLSHNKSLNIGTLRLLKDLYALYDKKTRKIKFNGIERSWDFYWQYAFENASIDWSDETISEFEPILDEVSPGGSHWHELSKHIKYRDLIIKFKDKLSIITIASNNLDILWDVELMEILLNDALKNPIFAFSDSLPPILRKIKITKEAILHFKLCWFKNYYESHYFAHWSDSSHQPEPTTIPLWRCLKENKNVIWDNELDSIFNKIIMTVIYPSIQLLRFTEKNFNQLIVGETFICTLKNISDDFPSKNNFECYINNLELASNEPHMPFSLVIRIMDSGIKETIDIVNIEMLEKTSKIF